MPKKLQQLAQLRDAGVASEVAAYLRYSRKTIRRMIDDGRLAGVMLGRSWRIPKQALAAMLEQAGISCEE